MIECKNLTKTYGKGKNAVRALRGVNFTLPDKGLVFIVGKSGSGKSTLLNILGGLDDATSGQLFVDGEDVCKLHPRELDNYRNYFVGIVYQHFNLFEEETVISNIKIATDISNKKIDDETIDKVIHKLDLDEKKNVLVKELSGGQKQRVAIARALAKYPRMILADEPTGNLDSKTSTIIHNYLKAISKEKLVVVISHDMANARKYADRLIEISDGKIINDLVKTTDDLSSNEINIGHDVSDEKVAEINEILRGKGYKLTKHESGFKPYEDNVKFEGEKISFKGRNKSWKNAARLSLKFWNSSKGSFFITALISTFIVGLVSLAHGFSVYDGGKAIETAVERYDAKNFVYTKGYSVTNSTKNVNKDFLIEINDSDMEMFSNKEKFGNAYQIIPDIVFASNEDLATGKIQKEFKSIYIGSSLGTMITDRTYFNKVFDNPKVLAGSLYNLESTSDLIITDYLADCILSGGRLKRQDGLPIVSTNPNDPYSGLVNGVTGEGDRLIWHKHRIGAVIDTGYKEKYKEIYDMQKQINLEPQNAGVLQSKLLSSDSFARISSDIQARLGYAYTFNPNYKSEYVNSDFCNYFYFKNAMFVDKNHDPVMNFDNSRYVVLDNALDEGTIGLSSKYYNELFSGGEVHSLTLREFDFSQNSSDFPRIEKEFNIKSATYVNDNRVMYMSKADFVKFADFEYAAYSLSFDNPYKAFNAYQVGLNKFFYSPNEVFSQVFNLIDIIKIFSQVFFFIAIILVALVVMVVVSHNLRIIKKNTYRLGVYKSLGYSAAALADSTILNSLIMIGAITLLSFALTLGLSSIMNQFLVSSFVKFLGSDIYASLILVEFNFPILAIYVGSVAALTLISTYLPVISIRKIKPNIIINKAD